MKSKLVALFLALCLCTQWVFATTPSTIDVSLIPWGEGETTYTTANLVNLTLNGQPLEGDVPAMIQEGRTLVPVRLVGEALDAQVLWVQQSGQIIITRGEDVMVLTLDSAQAIVNGVPTPLPDQVPAMTVGYEGASRTMVPLRFIMEGFGAQVEWDQETYTADIITYPDATADAIAVTDITFQPETAQILVATGGTPTIQLIRLEDRLVIDIQGASMGESVVGSLAINQNGISQLRYAQHGDTLYANYDQTFRIVLDYQSNFTTTPMVEVGRQSDGLTITLLSTGEGSVLPVPVNPGDFTIVLDPGHGGDNPGAMYEDIMEKDINLAVSQKLEPLLRSLGYTVVMTRYDDSTVDLYQRADIANAVEGDIFVSIHANATSVSSDFAGMYTYYHPLSKVAAVLAQAIQTPTAQITGAIDRGINSADFVVLRETVMPAVLVEMGFMTNHEELMNLIDEDYQYLLAYGMAEGIINYLNEQ